MTTFWTCAWKLHGICFRRVNFFLEYGMYKIWADGSHVKTPLFHFCLARFSGVSRLDVLYFVGKHDLRWILWLDRWSVFVPHQVMDGARPKFAVHFWERSLWGVKPFNLIFHAKTHDIGYKRSDWWLKHVKAPQKTIKVINFPGRICHFFVGFRTISAFSIEAHGNSLTVLLHRFTRDTVGESETTP